MGSEYLCDFSNTRFEEFTEDVVSYNIYEKYLLALGSLSETFLSSFGKVSVLCLT